MSRQRRTFTLDSSAKLLAWCLTKATATLMQRSRLDWLSRPSAGGSTSSSRTRCCHADQQGVNTRAAKDPGLEARINRLEREKSILKKATALLMTEEHERSR